MSRAFAGTLWDISRFQCVREFENFFQQSGTSDRTREDRFAKVIGHLLIAIIIQGAGFRLTVKAMPDLTPFKGLCGRVCGLPVEQVDELRIRDCVREFLNIVAGDIQAELSKFEL